MNKPSLKLVVIGLAILITGCCLITPLLPLAVIFILIGSFCVICCFVQYYRYAKWQGEIEAERVYYEQIRNVISYPLPKEMATKYNLENIEAVKAICNIITNTTNKLNSQRHTLISDYKIADFLFRRGYDELHLLTVDEVKNMVFGLQTLVFVYHSILCDKAYDKMMNRSGLINKMYLNIEGHTDAELKKVFRYYMDEAYFDTVLDLMMAAEDNPDTLSKNAFDNIRTPDGGQIFDIAINRLAKKYNQPNLDFVEEARN